MTNSYDELKDGIQNYHSNRTKIISHSIDTINLFKEVSDHLSQGVLKCFNTDTLCNSVKELGCLNINSNEEDIKNPVLAVIGTLKAGKSCFINSLLRKRVIPDSYSKGSARVIQLQYSKKSYLNIFSSSGVLEKSKTLRRRLIPEKYLKLLEEERRNLSKVSSIVHVGVNLNFLKCGLDIIDTPGFGENAVLTSVSKKIVEKALPIIIYVIDGKTSVKQSDIADLIELKDTYSQLEIIYFVTKLDTEDAEEHGSISDPIELAKYKMNIAFTKLQKSNLIPESFKNWMDCPQFHGASMLRRSQYLDKRINPETKYHNDLFSRFETALLSTLLHYFQNKIDHACDDLIGFIMAVLAKIINHAQNFANKVHENLAQITEITDLEEEMFEKIKQAITCSKEDLMYRLIERLKNDTDKIIDPIKEAEYPLSISIPEDGIVSDPLIIGQCQDNIRMVLVQGLENVIKEFVEEELFKKYKAAVENKFFSDIVNKFPQRKSANKGKSPYQVILEKMLDQNYKIEKLSTLSDEGTRNTTIEFMNVILSSLKNFLSNIFPQILKNNNADVNSPAWKLTQAHELLQKMSIHLLAEDVCKKLIEDFHLKHQSFLEALEVERLFIQQKIIDIDEIRVKVIDNAPGFFEKLLNAVAIKGNYRFRDVKDLEEIGDQGSMFKCSLNDITFARKIIKLEGKDKEEIKQIKNRLSEEVYYSLTLSHKRILPVIGVSMTENEQMFSIFYPLMKCNLEEFINENILSQKDKLMISYQVAEGIKYLHDHDIMHRNLKVDTILIDESNNVFLSGFGFKSEALSHRSLDGFPDHVAPEIINKGIYKKSIDIYSYGKLVLFLLKGKRKMFRQSIDCDQIQRAMLKITNEIIKLLPDLPEPISKLIINCCNTQADERPDIDTILEVLHEHLSK